MKIQKTRRDQEHLEWARFNATPTELDNWNIWLTQSEIPHTAVDALSWPGLAQLHKRLQAHSIINLPSFGDVAAEDDSVLKYFLSTDAALKVREGSAQLILGRKGSGKTALVRHFTDKSSTSEALNLGQYPWNVHEQRSDPAVSDVEAYVSSWRYLIAVKLASLIIAHPSTNLSTTEAVSVIHFLKDNYGGATPELADIIRPPTLKLDKASFEPQIFGNKLGSISLSRSNINAGRELTALTDALLDAITTIAKDIDIEKLMLHFDELDRGLVTFNEARKNLLIGLILAARDVNKKTKENGLNCSIIVYLRSDLWEQLRFSDKNKISQTTTLNLEWNSETLKDLIKIRIQSSLQPKSSWDLITSPSLMRGSQTKWDHIVTRTFLRPRDVIQFLNTTLRVVKSKQYENGAAFITNTDVMDSRQAYSSYLKQELEDEITPHWAQWEDAIRACTNIATVTFKLDEFTERYEQSKSKGSQIDAIEALRLLYSFSVIGYESRSGFGGSSWTFHYQRPQAGWDANAVRFKVHVGLKEVFKLSETRTAKESSSTESKSAVAAAAAAAADGQLDL